MNLKRVCLLTIAFLIAMSYVNTLTHSQDSASQNAVTEQRQAQSDSEKIAVLQAQLELMREYDQRLLATVYWSLGGMITVVIVIVGVGWYTNFKLYERDKAALAQELKTSLREEARAAGRTAVDEIARDLKSTQYSLLELKAGQWEAQGVYENILRTHLKMIEKAQEIGSDAYLMWTLEDMQRVLKARTKEHQKFGMDTVLHTEIVKEITKMLDDIPKSYSLVADNIRQLLRPE